MERGVATGSEQGTPESEMGDGDNDSVDYGGEMDVDAVGNGSAGVAASSAAYVERAGAYDGVDPFEGMEFDDEEDAWTFYNVYAHRVGFSTRISVMHRSRRDGSIMSRQFVCAKEGFRTYRGKNEVSPVNAGSGEDSGRGRRTRAVTRVGCKAMIRVKKQDNGRWMVTKLEIAHNHTLVPPNQAHCLRPHKPLSECGKQRTFGGPRNGGMLIAIEPPPLPISPPVLQTSVAQVVPRYTGDSIGDHTRVILDYVKHMQAEDPAFFYAMQFVDGHPIGNIFWADARARMSYKHFGDTIFLDDYCKRSKYQLPFVAFTGVNHHCQPVLFGCAIIGDNSEASFIWLFETLLLAMSSQHPDSLTTEYDSSIQSAALKVLPKTRHRFCRWHILNEGRDKLSHLSNLFPSLHEELVNCINMSETIDEFEANCKTLISKVGPGNSEWLYSMYNCRQHWVPVYLRDTFFGVESSKQECESKSSFFDGYISAKTDSQSFIQQYEKALDGCYEKEVKEEFETKYSLPEIKTSSLIEKQGADLYTRSMFLKFQQELIDASVSTVEIVKEDGKSCIYKVTKFAGSEKPHIVVFKYFESSVTCSCRMFEHLGIVCRHILTVFGTRSVALLPSQYIVKRWTKDAMERSTDKKINEVSRVNEPKEEQKSGIEDGEQSQTWRYNSLCREALRYAEEGASSGEVYIVAMQSLQEAANKVNMAKRGIGQVAPLAVKPISAQPPENFGKVHEISYNQQKKRKRNSNNKTRESSLNQLMYLQQPVNFLFVATGTSGGPQGPSQIVAARPVSLSASNGQTSSSNHSIDGNATPSSVAPKKTSELSNCIALVSAPALGNAVQEGETQSSGFASQTKESHELSQGNGNKGNNANIVSFTSLPQLVTVPVGLCFSSMDSSKIPAGTMNSVNSGGVLSNGNAPFGLCQSQSTHSQTRTLGDSADYQLTPEGSSIRAAAIAAGARIASPSDAASIIKAAESKGAIHIKPGEGIPNCLKPLAPKPLSSLPPANIPSSVHASKNHLQPGQGNFGDSAAAKDAIFGSSDSSDDDEYDDDDDTDDDGEDEGVSGDEM
ncbi:hypothetical protein GUJ93_ZPchr0013g33933 [Zizania palustris]|uniref:SWIM-type domain-containing protein n=1 Tax=Zizania palustris TaxID=103762 RepID=A0A8J5WYX9_ZIZPA|nr:hypothetical protein GUJ93_ZPchr0013g33933 [Zizania palustris]